MFEDDNRTSRRGITIIQRYNKTIVARCDFVHPRGKMAPSGSISPLGCTKRHGPRHSVQQLYTGILAQNLFFKLNMKSPILEVQDSLMGAMRKTNDGFEERGKFVS